MFAFTLGHKSCAELLNAGFTEDGVYQILTDPQSEMIDVYCDQSSRGGGNRNAEPIYSKKLTRIALNVLPFTALIKETLQNC